MRTPKSVGITKLSELTLDQTEILIPWVSLDGFTVGGDTGYAISCQGAFVGIEAAPTTNYDAYVRTTGFWRKIIETGKTTSIEIIIQDVNAEYDVISWLRLVEGYTDPPSEIYHHLGWKIINPNIYASNANGASQQITDTGVDLVSGSQWTRLKIVYKYNTSCKFYINEDLKVTHTTNLPTAGILGLQIQIRTTEAAEKSIYLGRVLIRRGL